MGSLAPSSASSHSSPHTRKHHLAKDETEREEEEGQRRRRRRVAGLNKIPSLPPFPGVCVGVLIMGEPSPLNCTPVEDISAADLACVASDGKTQSGQGS